MSKNRKKLLVHKKIKDAQCPDRSFLSHEFFFMRFIVFQLWPILYFAVVNSVRQTFFLENFLTFFSVLKSSETYAKKSYQTALLEGGRGGGSLQIFN